MKNPFDNMSFHEIITDDAEFIPLMTQEEEEALEREKIPNNLAILPIRNTVLFPGVVMPISVGRDRSIKLINDAQNGEKLIGVVAQKLNMAEEPKPNDLYEVGTVAKILRLLKMPDGNITVIIQGKSRFEITEYTQTDPYFRANIKALQDKTSKRTKDSEFEAVIESIKEISLQIINENPNIPSEASFALKNIESPSFLVHFTSSNLNLEVAKKQELLTINNLKKRALEVLKYLHIEFQQLSIKNDIQNKTRVDLDKQQREYFLNQQMKTIQEELGGVSQEEEHSELRKRANQKKWNEKVMQHFEKELKKLQRTPSHSPDYSLLRNYLEFMLDLPWDYTTKDFFDLHYAEKILNQDHYGLEKVKERILEHLAVLKLKGDMKSPILCLYGPPGVGKTSLGKSIAKSLKRNYQRVALGGMHDESEIRGHRKTYIGAMSGRILQAIKKAESNNPVFVLDEIDKMGNSHHGDPSSAMLEVLDPEQNNSFYDNYLEIEYDLSKVMFIATANNLNTIQPALLDRMEIIEINGYTLEEKIEIAKRHLLPKHILDHGLQKKDILLNKNVLAFLIEGYTRESGVRGLDKILAKMVRYAAKNKVMKQNYIPKINQETVEKILGPAHLLRDKYENNHVIGVVTGLAWTAVGGDILFIESSISKGKGQLSMTGNLGTVMKESATIALEYIKAHTKELNLQSIDFEAINIHIHVPEGATPKDGPSAGVTMLTSLVSSLSQKKIRSHLAMTGEITLRGKVLAVGGIKEKILAAKRASIQEIILCHENEKDVLDIKQEYLKGLTFHYVTTMDEVLKIALS